MGSRRRLGTSLQVLLAAGAALSVGGAVAIAASGSGGTITGCVLTNQSASDSTQPVGSLRVLEPGVTNDESCTTNQETQITWNQTGPTARTARDERRQRHQRRDRRPRRVRPRRRAGSPRQRDRRA